MSKITKKNSETGLPLRPTCIDGTDLSLGQLFQANQGKPFQDRDFAKRFFVTLANDLLQREVSKCQTC